MNKKLLIFVHVALTNSIVLGFSWSDLNPVNWGPKVADFFTQTVYEKGLKETIYEQGIEVGAQGFVDLTKNAANDISGFFHDNKVTRAADYAIRKAALESALGVATATLESTKAIATGSLVASRETAKVSLAAAEGFLDQVVKNVSSGVMIGAAEAAKGILEGIKKGAEWTIEGSKITLTKGPLNWVDINEMKYSADFKELGSGVLGHVTILAEVFNQQISINNVSIDPKKSFTDLTTDFKGTVIDPLANLLVNKILGPIKDALNKIGNTLKPTHDTIAQMPQTQDQIEQALLQAVTTSLTAKDQVTSITQQHDAATQQVAATLNDANDKAKAALQQQAALLQAAQAGGSTASAATTPAAVTPATSANTPALPTPAAAPSATPPSVAVTPATPASTPAIPTGPAAAKPTAIAPSAAIVVPAPHVSVGEPVVAPQPAPAPAKTKAAATKTGTKPSPTKKTPATPGAASKVQSTQSKPQQPVPVPEGEGSSLI